MAPTVTRSPIRALSLGAVVCALVAASLAGCSTPAAAFDVTSIEIVADDTEILPGDQVEVTARVENSGTIAGTYAATLTVDGVQTDSQDVQVDAGGGTTVRFSLDAGAPGDHDIALGPQTVTLHVSAGPNFVVSGVRLASDATEILAGDPVEFVAEVENVGTLAGTFEATFSVDGIVQEQQPVDLGVGRSTTVRFATTAGGSGDHTVDIGGVATTLTVLEPAAVAVTALELVPEALATDEALAAAVTVANTGGATGTITVKVTIDKKKAATQDVTVAGGQSATVEIPLDVPKAGKHTVAVGDLDAKLVVWKITRPSNGKVLVNKIRGGLGRLTIENGNDVDAVLVLARKSSPKKAVLVVYVRKGKDATVKGIRDGTYIVYYSLGKRWDSKSRAFTSDVERSRFEDTIKFKTKRTSTLITYDVWTLTLNAVVGGNAPTEDVGAGDFPGVP